jgi:hypothetical protein
MKPAKTDLGLGILGLGMSVTMFLAQGPYTSAWQYAAGLSPLLLAGTGIVAYRSVLKARRIARVFVHAKTSYDLVAAADITSTFTVRVVNENGDVTYDRDYRIELVKNGVTLKRTKLDLVGSEAAIPDFPPGAVITDSNPAGVRLEPRDVSTTLFQRGGRPHYDYRWCYEIIPPLQRKGDYVSFAYSGDVPASEGAAFTENGSIFFFYHETIAMDVINTLIAPPKHRIAILDSWIEDWEGHRSDLPAGTDPELDEARQVLRWRPPYRKGRGFFCRYRLLPIGHSGAALT